MHPLARGDLVDAGERDGCRGAVESVVVVMVTAPAVVRDEEAFESIQPDSVRLWTFPGSDSKNVDRIYKAFVFNILQ